jgi:NAD dependent epimerase/dehydratase family enzyme
MVNPDARGAFNVTAPGPVTNAAFTRALGRALHRPTIIPVPVFALRLLFGELADTLLTGQRAIPLRAQEMGFPFRFAHIDDALRDLLQKGHG